MVVGSGWVPGFWVLGAGWVLGAWVLGAGCRVPDARCWVPGSEGVLGVGSWVPGCVLSAGY